MPGHELAGIIVATGRDISRFKVGERVTVPFVAGCGRCHECHSGNHQVCPNQQQPGFTYWGSFAEYVDIHYADTNLVHLPEQLDFATAASLGCRFATSFRAVVDQAAAVLILQAALDAERGSGRPPGELVRTDGRKPRTKDRRR